LARPIVLIPHLFRLAGVVNFRKDYSPPPLVRHLDPSALTSISLLAYLNPDGDASGTQRFILVRAKDP